MTTRTIAPASRYRGTPLLSTPEITKRRFAREPELAATTYKEVSTRSWLLLVKRVKVQSKVVAANQDQNKTETQ